MTEKKASAIEFPCYFPIKIMGVNSEHFKDEITALVLSHFPGNPAPQLTCNASQKGNYLAITASIYVCDQKTLDLLYQDLTKHPDVKMVL